MASNGNGKQAEINKAQAHQPKCENRGSPARAPKHAAGEETHYSKAAWDSKHMPLHGLHSKGSHGR
jgi:hypothetical protein